MSFTGEDIADAIRQWMTKEVTATPDVRVGLGKHFFSVSAGTIGILISLEKLARDPVLDILLVLSMAVLFCSMVVALVLAIPPLWQLNSFTDLYEVYNSHVKQIRWLMFAWFVLWILGLLPGLYSVL